MDNTHALRTPPRQVAGIGISLAVHAVLLALWQVARPVHVPDTSTPDVMVLQLLPTPAPRGAPASDAMRTTPAPRATATAASRPAPARAADPLPPVQEALPEAAATEAAPADAASALAGEAPAPPPSGSMLERARAAAGGIDRTLRTDNPRRGIVAPIVTPQMKLERGLARANELAPNKWYEAPKVEEVLDPSHYDRRRYRVVGAAGTYCVTYESHHAPDGLDTMRDGIKPKLTTCDVKWSPPTVQKWN